MKFCVCELITLEPSSAGSVMLQIAMKQSFLEEAFIGANKQFGIRLEDHHFGSPVFCGISAEKKSSD